VRALPFAYVVGTVFLGGPSSLLAQPTQLPPEPPAPMPEATTLPSYRGRPALGAEAPAKIPPATTLPSARRRTLGPEPPAPIPPAGTLPSYYRGIPSQPSPPRAAGRPVMVPNGNGTSTIIGPDGTMRTVPTPR
jgi:hypothetical protein